MLQSLLIKNYALIEHLEFGPSRQFNIITGETGAGKSIILGAIGLLTGGRADTKALLNENEKCIVEGTFDLSAYPLAPLFSAHELDYEDIATIRREISPQGKSRAFINDTPVTLETLKEIAGSLIDVHSQHDNLLLGTSDFQLNMADIFAGNKTLLEEYRKHYRSYRQLRKQIESLQALALQSKKDFDYENFQLNELLEARLTEGEQAPLEEELNVLENTEEIKLKLNQCLQALSEGEISINAALASVISHLNHISKLSHTFESLKERAASSLAELKEIARELGREEEKTEADPARAADIRARLDVIYKLQKKHQVADIKALLALQEELAKKVASFQSLDSQMAEAEMQLQALLKTLDSLAGQLTASRENIFGHIEANLGQLLAELGMPNATFRVKNEATDYSDKGRDKIQMLFSANKGVEPVPLKNAASGGEFSRLMFALKYLVADKTALPTMIFDEIDTGISGEIAMKMGIMMQKMAQQLQIITITHLHQIAARGDTHFYVFKEDSGERTRTSMRILGHTERVQQIAEMIGGKNPSATAYESAKELIAN